MTPKIVFHYFDEICKVPRPSKKEEKIRAFLIDFAKYKGLEYKVDEAGNVLIKRMPQPEWKTEKPLSFSRT